MKKWSFCLVFAAAFAMLGFAPNTAEACPKNCVTWYDGCNTCKCVNGRVTVCTRRYCKRKGRAFCKQRKIKRTCRSIRCRRPRRCTMSGGKPKCVCPRLAIRCQRGYVAKFKMVGGCKIPYCKKIFKLSCRSVRCRKPRRCVMTSGRPKCVCPRLAIRCQRGYVAKFKMVGGCKIPYCKKIFKLSCRSVRCRKPRRCVMTSGKPKCICPRLAIRCQRGYVAKFKMVGGCKIPYCKKIFKLSCRSIRCRRPRRCVMTSGRPKCVCPRLAIRCQRGYVAKFKMVGGCKIPYCKKIRCAKPCARNCSVWYDGCNTCKCVNGCTTSCTRRHCIRKGRSRCVRR